ncbi:UV-endonuclease UVE-1 [Talaromyces stipitatus ATCC 10500]|uniref:UV-endonuclease UVE-1 n=1 Tax=Talaromyces stipitatus (strain ATCC 10500 / CBS 375.48 / QM 6759 / NRRL 1006) TaxID=441959 RepID=B8MQN4_TALSN|nr:UV-endonuclease UVE-1 [Talaromyces stipitatus ATCC 10500]EED13457.1 UV-endonuclease UVE-1 [Talaromyces stipitatus ATCC 10500]
MTAVAKSRLILSTKKFFPSSPTQRLSLVALASTSNSAHGRSLSAKSVATTPPVSQATNRVVGMIMARSTTRVAAVRATRSLHTSPAAVGASNTASLSAINNVLESVPSPGKKKAASLDPESDEDVPADVEEVKEALSRPPPVNSDYLPLPWKGRLGYACLNTYLRYANPPVFSSRTCRIASILENRHPLQDPSQPFHATKNRPDREQPADHARGQAYVEALGLANARDIVKMLRWNERYGIKFLRLSSEMFPFASHEIYGYKLAPFASEVLADAGRVAAELGHRLTMHPGQFTQLGSPRKEVIESSIRDLEFHSELLQLLKLPPQQNRDAVMILHMGGVFGDKEATLDRFRENYKGLSADIKNRLVLENDDVSWSVHDLLPICEELNIPLVLDYHHHSIIFDSDKLREGTLDIMQLYDRIRATWTRKGITQKMHYSEPEPTAITPRQRRKHNPRVYTLPPCDPTMDLMIEAKDKEQAVFELMRKFKLPGHERIGEIVPHVREDENKPWKPPKKTKKANDFIDLAQLTPPPLSIPLEEVSMGGPEGRVYWPSGCEEWLRPKKRVIVRKNAAVEGVEAVEPNETNSPAKKSSSRAKSKVSKTKESPKPKTKVTKKATSKTRKRRISEASIGSTSSSEKDPSSDPLPSSTTITSTPTRRSSRAKKISYAEDDSA